MKKAIVKQRSEYDRGSYEITGAGKWNGTIWGNQRDAVIQDLKDDGYKVFVNEWVTPPGTWERKEILKQV